jgi:hypothetical protein
METQAVMISYLIEETSKSGSVLFQKRCTAKTDDPKVTGSLDVRINRK